jgi:hypothetical protein
VKRGEFAAFGRGKWPVNRLPAPPPTQPQVQRAVKAGIEFLLYLSPALVLATVFAEPCPVHLGRKNQLTLNDSHDLPTTTSTRLCT